MPPRIERRASLQCISSFTSKEEVTSLWQRLVEVGGERLSRPATGLSRTFAMLYAPGNGWRYTISLARKEDVRGLATLSDEFVVTHKAFFSEEYPDVDGKIWSRYLGLPTEAARGQLHAVANASKRVGWHSNSAPLSVHAFRDGGCVLKCEAERTEADDTEDGAGEESRGSQRSTASALPSPAEPLMVGYIHFTLEEGSHEEDGAGRRHSKRLKMKRGERTGEYTKVSHIVVSEGHRGLGLGSLLLAAMLECVRRLEPLFAREVFLTAMERNECAVQLYRRLGFSVFGENATNLSKGCPGPPRLIVWYQMGLTWQDSSGGDAEESVRGLEEDDEDQDEDDDEEREVVPRRARGAKRPRTT